MGGVRFRRAPARLHFGLLVAVWMDWFTCCYGGICVCWVLGALVWLLIADLRFCLVICFLAFWVLRFDIGLGLVF